jgi:rod shape-determining protein MreC
LIRLSIPMRQALARLMLPLLMAASFGMMLLFKADLLLAEQARSSLGDVLAPIYSLIAPPLMRVRAGVGEVVDFWNMQDELVRLREENATLRRWQAVAMALDAENAALKANLHWVPDAAPSFVTARVIDDAGGLYARAVLLAIGPTVSGGKGAGAPGAGGSVSKGQIALDAQGLVGRVSEVGARSARVLLITDLNSRFPVVLERTGVHALLVGTNTSRPRLMYWPEGSPPVEGERVVTSAEANAFPAGLPVGVVHYNASHMPEVQPFARLDRLEIVRVFDYGLRGLLAPEAPADKAGDRPAMGRR